jgi:hypothetical protein
LGHGLGFGWLKVFFGGDGGASLAEVEFWVVCEARENMFLI